MTTLVLILALVAIGAGAYAALRSDVTAAGLAIVALGLAVLLPLVVR